MTFGAPHHNKDPINRQTTQRGVINQAAVEAFLVTPLVPLLPKRKNPSKRLLHLPDYII
jgi:hypothetical protein